MPDDTPVGRPLHLAVQPQQRCPPGGHQKGEDYEGNGEGAGRYSGDASRWEAHEYPNYPPIAVGTLAG